MSSSDTSSDIASDIVADTNSLGTRRSSVCLFCGSSGRVDSVYRDAATAFGRSVAEAGLDLVYGGGKVGLMGLAANAALEAGGRVIGVIPKFLLDLEVGHGDVTELVVTDSMHDRKRTMYERSDAFATLPGGLGTLDETMEVLTWSQLGLSKKPVVLVNVNGFWDPMLALLDHIVETGFARPENRRLYQVADGVEAAVGMITALPAPDETGPISAKWV